MLLLCSSVYAQNTQDANKYDDSFSEIPKIQLDGWLSLYISHAEVEKHLGQPTSKTDFEMCEATGSLVQTWDYKDKGIILEMENVSQEDSCQVSFISILKPCWYKTDKGVGIGTDKKEVEEKYKDVNLPQAFYNNEYLLGVPYLGMSLIFKDDQVEKMMIGAFAE